MEGERTFRCTIGSLGETVESATIAPPAVFVIGDVAGLTT